MFTSPVAYTLCAILVLYWLIYPVIVKKWNAAATRLAIGAIALLAFEIKFRNGFAVALVLAVLGIPTLVLFCGYITKIFCSMTKRKKTAEK